MVIESKSIEFIYKMHDLVNANKIENKTICYFFDGDSMELKAEVYCDEE